MVAKRRAIEMGADPETIAELTAQVNTLANIVVFASAGANREGKGSSDPGAA